MNTVLHVSQNGTQKDISLTWKIRIVRSIYVCVCKFVCVCVREREIERERERDGERGGDVRTDCMMEQFDRKCFFL